MKKIVKVICAIIENDQSEILCTLNSKDNTFSNFWNFPGRVLKEGEGVENAITNYIYEKFRCEIKVNSLFSATTYEYDTHILNLIVAKSTLIDSISLQTENTKHLWLSVENIKSINWHPSINPTINKLIIKHKRKSISA